MLSHPLPNRSVSSRQFGSAHLWSRLLVVTALLLFTKYAGLYAVTVETDQARTSPIHTLELPQRIGLWHGENVRVDPVVYQVLRPDAVLQKHYRLNSHTSKQPLLTKPLGGANSEVPTAKTAPAPTAEVDTIVIYSRDVRGFHSPDICLTTQGWVISSTSQHEVREGDQAITLTVLHGEKGGGHAYLAYFFADTQNQVRGWVPTLAKLVGARLLRRRAGAVQIQFAYDVRSLQPNGEFTPQLSALMLSITQTVQKTLAMERRKRET